MSEIFRAKQIRIGADLEGDVEIKLLHDCGCCCSVVYLKPEQMGQLCARLLFAAAQGTATKGSLMLVSEGRA